MKIIFKDFVSKKGFSKGGSSDFSAVGLEIA